MACGNNVQIQKSQEKLQNRCRANSASYEYKNMSANNGAFFGSHGNSNSLLQNMISKNYIDFVF